MQRYNTKRQQFKGAREKYNRLMQEYNEETKKIGALLLSTKLAKIFNP